jgi:ribonuclease HI
MIVYTDGSCIKNPGVGAWAFIIVENDTIVKESCGYNANTTNNRMELTAVIEALKYGNQKIEILYSDSEYVVKGITDWLPNWIIKDFKNVKNSDLWKSLCVLLFPGFGIEHVRAHRDNKWNNYVDNLARSTALHGINEKS